MITIRILGPYPSCSMCAAAETECRKAAADFPGQVEVAHEDMLTAEFGMYRDMVPPIILISSQLVSTGKVMPANELRVTLEQQLNP